MLSSDTPSPEFGTSMPQPATDQNSYDHVVRHGTDAGGQQVGEEPSGEERASDSEEERERACQ